MELRVNLKFDYLNIILILFNMLRFNLKKDIRLLNMANVKCDRFIVYTDGACTNNGRKNARSSIGVYFSDNNLFKIDSVSRALNVPKHTNNIAELTAIKESLKLIDINNVDKINYPINVYTDSEYSLNVITKWYPNWSDKQKSTKQNIPLIKEIYELCIKLNPQIIHIKAHTGNDDEHSLGNAVADQLATDALKKFENKTEDISNTFSDGPPF